MLSGIIFYVTVSKFKRKKQRVTYKTFLITDHKIINNIKWPAILH